MHVEFAADNGEIHLAVPADDPLAVRVNKVIATANQPVLKVCLVDFDERHIVVGAREAIVAVIEQDADLEASGEGDEFVLLVNHGMHNVSAKDVLL
jgi:hypothetical protein